MADAPTLALMYEVWSGGKFTGWRNPVGPGTTLRFTSMGQEIRIVKEAEGRPLNVVKATDLTEGRKVVGNVVYVLDLPPAPIPAK